eukprot:scaffold31728_cov54-Attheya_sp.AAC.1
MSGGRFFGGRVMSSHSLVSSNSRTSNSAADDGNSSSDDDSAGGTENMMELHNSSTFSDLAFKKSFADVSARGLDNAYGHDSAGSSQYSSSSSSSIKSPIPIKPDKNLKLQKSSSTQATDWSAFDESFCEPPSQSDGLTGIDTLDPLTGKPMLSNKPIPTRALSNPNFARKKQPPPPKPIVRKLSVKQVTRPKPMPAVAEKQRSARFGSSAAADNVSSGESDYSSDSRSASESESEPPEQGQTLIGFRAVDPRTGLPLPREDSMRSKGSRESIKSPIILAPVRETTAQQTPAAVNQRPPNAIANGKGSIPDVSNDDDESAYESGSDYESEEEPPEQDDGLTGINTIDPITGQAILSKPKPIRVNERAVRPAAPRGSALRQTHPVASNKPAARQQSTSSAPPARNNQSGTRRQEDSESEYSSGSGSEYETDSSGSGSEYETGTDYTSSTAGDGLHTSKDDESSDDEEGRAIMKHIMMDSINDPDEENDSRPQRSNIPMRTNSKRNNMDSINDPDEENESRPQRSTIPMRTNSTRNNMDNINDPDEENDSRPQRSNIPMRTNSTRASQRGLQDSLSDPNIEDGKTPVRTNSSRSAGNTRMPEPKNNSHGRGGEQ